MIASLISLSALLVSCPLFPGDESLGIRLLDQIDGRWQLGSTEMVGAQVQRERETQLLMSIPRKRGCFCFLLHIVLELHF